ncbi:MAG: hypothetical protein FJ145_24685 [Deltaproteobacteria bacterium]|nr:hypothetical protein [Deltaproteobacteria bacterium]
MLARAIKQTYYEILERAHSKQPGNEKIDFLIEPNDMIEVAAGSAKAKGVLKRAKKGFHLTLPTTTMFIDQRTRRTYIAIPSELIEWLIASRS